MATNRLRRTGGSILRALGYALFVLLTVAFGGFGAYIAVTGSRADRLIGVAIAVLFFSPVVLVLGSRYVRARTTGDATGVEARIVEHHGRSRRGLVFPVPRGRSALALLATVLLGIPCAIFGFGAGTLAETSESTIYGTPILLGVLGFGGLTFFSLLAVVALLTLRGQSSLSLALIEEGIVLPSPLGARFVPWNVLAGVDRFERRGSTHLGLTVTDRAAIEQPWWAEYSGRLTRFAWGYDVAFSTDAFASSGERIERAVRRFLDHPGERTRLTRDRGAELSVTDRER
jgi:hypothetical protein